MRASMILAKVMLLLNCGAASSQQLIVAYDFNGEVGNSSAADRSGFGSALDASLASGAAIVNDPIRGHVLQTSASGFGAQTLYDSKLDFTSSFTLQARIKTPPGSSVFQHIAGRPGVGPRMFNHWGLGGLGAAQRNNPFQGFNPVDFGPGGSSDGHWHHLLVTWNHTTGDLTGCYDGACRTNNDPSSALVTHPGLIFSIGGNPVSNGNPLPNTLVDDVAYWNGWADSAAISCLANATCDIYNAPLIDPVDPPQPSVYPHPIVKDAFNDFFINTSGDFASSGLTLNVSRYALIPDSGGIARPRLSALRYAHGVDGVFVVDEGLSGQQSPATGSIYHVTNGGATVTNVLNVGSVLPLQHSGMLGQGGLRSVAFHPQFAQPGTPGYGKLYTSQVMSRQGNEQANDYLGPQNPPLNTEGGFPNSNRFDSVLGEWSATFDAEGRFAGIDPTSFRQMFRIAMPSTQHPIKQISFNPYAQRGDEDYGLLYVLHGDGVNSNTAGTGLDGANALGKVLRIDPLEDGPDAYGIPPTNPFVNNPTVLDEIFTLGHRNVHQIAFGVDSQNATQIFVSEIGQESVDEINLLEAGASYGWGEREGTFTRVGNSIGPLGDTADQYRYPVAQYGHIEPGGNAITGGYVVNNGSELEGYYFFGDFSNGEKPLFAISVDDAVAAITTGSPELLAPTQPLLVDLLFDHDDNPGTPSIAKSSFLDIVDDEPTYDGSDRTDLRFGQGPGGELYLLNKRNGWIYLVENSVNTFLDADFNKDGKVNDLDLAIWQANYGLNQGASTAVGDSNGDGKVNGSDFLAWQRLYLSGSAEPLANNIPEPSSCALIYSILPLLFKRKLRT